MKVTVQKQEKELLVQTVLLSKDKEDPLNIYLFRCPYCSTGLVEVQGKINKISEGVAPTDDVITIQQCKKCKKLYTFQTLDFKDTKNTKITLISQPKTIGVFYCWHCRNPLLQFMDDKVMKFPDFKLMKIPFEISCINSLCPEKYKIVDIV